jgi:hypothetical protein
MIEGFFGAGATPRPLIELTLEFVDFPNVSLDATFLIDTGAFRTMIGPVEALRLQQDLRVPLTDLRAGGPSMGVGGFVPTRVTPARMALANEVVPLSIHIMEPVPPVSPIPCLLGRDILSQFVVHIDQSRSRVFLARPDEIEGITLASGVILR